MPVSIADCPRVVLRSDASAEVGFGHLVRSLALGRELEDIGWSVVFCGSGATPELAGSRSIELVPAEPDGDPATALAYEPHLVVVDGYRFGADFFEHLDMSGVAYVVIDDNGDTPARRPLVVVNQNPHATPAMYDHLDGAPLLLLGTDYAMLRREVVEAARAPRRDRTDAVLVAFGGSDQRGLTTPIAQALADEGFEVRVAVGPGHPGRTSTVAALDRHGRITVIEPSAYVAELATSRVAVLAAGSSLWEAACLGTPTVAVVVADNQHGPALAARRRGLVAAALVADERLVTALPGVVAEVVGSPRPTTDPPGCDGARRVALALDELVERISLRPATVGDLDFLFSLRTDSDVARQSFGPAPNREGHFEWLRGVLGDEARRLLIVEDRRGPIGQVRLDEVAEGQIISIALIARARGRRLAAPVLEAAKAHAVGDLLARIKADNAASIAAFRRAGFTCTATDSPEVMMRWWRDPRFEREPKS